VTRLRPAFLAAIIAGAAACSAQPQPGGTPGSAAPATSPAKAAQPHAFRGKVERIDKSARSVMVAGEDVTGWMAAMTMPYEVEPPDVVEKLAVGDRITATVYDGDFKTLHDVKIVPAPPK
jgi:Cu/Ag efflux protein CusF